jgi:hypothetical protein
MNNEIILDGMVWSFSRLNTYETCPYSFYKQYILKEEGDDNGHAQLGTLCHEILESYLKGELESYELSGVFVKRFPNFVTAPFAKNKYVDLKLRGYQRCKEYFDTFEGFDEFKYDKDGIEKEVKFKLGGFDFIGYIDLFAKNEEGGLEVIDHKTKGKFSSKKEMTKYLRQLYLYSLPIYEEFNEYPQYLNFNMIRELDWIQVKFDKDDYEETLKWATDIINQIYEDIKWLPKSDAFFCKSLCNFGKRFCEFAPTHY